MDSTVLPVVLDRLDPGSRSWLIAKAAQLGVDPEKVVRKAIEDLAEKDGFKPGSTEHLPKAA